jgi:hypothetical protein
LGYGVYGVAADGYGVYGISANRVGVSGFSDYGSGVSGVANGAGVGVSGYNTSLTGFAAYFEGYVRVNGLANGGNHPLCTDDTKVLASCSSSLRYKTNVRPFAGGLDIVNRLRPIAFTWKAGGAHDVGLAAEDVEKVEPLLTFRNDKGEIEGVKYNQLSAVFVNAFIEQQAQIKKAQEQIDALKALACQLRPDADICQ